MKIEQVFVTPRNLGTGTILPTIRVKVKNSTIGREYVVHEWPGNTKVRHPMICCPFTALITCLSIRGSLPGYPFSTVNQ